jgi:hypothetical protein
VEGSNTILEENMKERGERRRRQKNLQIRITIFIYNYDYMPTCPMNNNK